MKKTIFLIWFVPFLSFGQISNNKWEKLNKKSVIPYLEGMFHKVDVIKTKNNKGNLIIFTGISDQSFGKEGYEITLKQKMSITFFNGSAIQCKNISEMTRKNMLKHPDVINNTILINFLKPEWEKVIKSHKKEFLDYRNNWYGPYMADNVITDTENRYETDLYESAEGYIVKTNASMDVSDRDIGITQFLSTIVTVPGTKYLLGENINIDDVNNYDIPSMINSFIIDLKYYFSQNNKNNKVFENLSRCKVISKFQSLEGNTIALSKGFNDDGRVEVLIDPTKWENSSAPKRWYILYHELGHDILNLEHGNGGKMMFNFVDKDYIFSEFFNDRKYMFDHYGLIKGLKPNN